MTRESENINIGREWPMDAETVLRSATLLRRSTSGGNADVYVLERNGCRYLVKSYERHSALAKFFFSFIAVNNEWRLLNRLNQLGLAYAPKPVARIGKWTIITEYIEGNGPLKNRKHYTDLDMPKTEFFTELIEAYRQLHALGIVHGDVRRQNILIDKNGHPRIIDWATGTIVGEKMPKWRLISRGFHRIQGISDFSSLAKIVNSYYKGMVPKEMQESSDNCLLKVARAIRQNIYRPLKHLFSRHKKR